MLGNIFSSKKLIFVLFITSITAIGYFSPSLAAIMLIWLFPSILALILDRSEKGELAAHVAMFNIIGIVKNLLPICKNNQSMEAIGLEALSSYDSAMIIFAFSALGWVLYYLMPLIFTNILKRYLMVNLSRTQRKIRKFKAEWRQN